MKPSPSIANRPASSPASPTAAMIRSNVARNTHRLQVSEFDSRLCGTSAQEPLNGSDEPSRNTAAWPVRPLPAEHADHRPSLKGRAAADARCQRATLESPGGVGKAPLSNPCTLLGWVAEPIEPGMGRFVNQYCCDVRRCCFWTAVPSAWVAIASTIGLRLGAQTVTIRVGAAT